ncbi:MAG: hypothetical protein CML25_02275 [Rhizobiales bacterium]|nr:hypothetical protein [Hyphomicrobiales bacterium]|tara:strand:+ start:779 stop:1120 length:342 start_codon:yes stop_codon:yes gene_type:complete
MYWLIIILTLAGMPEIKVEIPFDKETYCNFAKDKIVSHPPTVVQDNQNISFKIKKAECVRRDETALKQHGETNNKRLREFIILLRSNLHIKNHLAVLQKSKDSLYKTARTELY